MNPATPHLAIDGARLQANLTRVQDAADARGVALRPHVKTHKSVQIARMQRDAGARGITVATLGEAEVFVAGGFDDVLIAYPVYLDDAALARARALTEHSRLIIGVDSVEGVRRAAPLAGAAELMIEVDAGHHRTGVKPDAAGALATEARGVGIDLAGVFTFPGHSYAPGVAGEVAEAEVIALDVAAGRLEASGAPVVRSGGSTPSLAATLDARRTPDELRPGVYVFGDAQQWELGHIAPDDIALTCIATVVSHAGGRAVLDAGSKVLGADRAAYATGFGRLLDDPEARIVLLSEHHAVVETPGPLPRVGDRVRVVPNHVCTAVNLVDTVWIDGEAVGVDARGRNS